MNYYAHSVGSSKADWQLLHDHLEAVAWLSARFASRFNGGSLGRAVGLLHDLGKYSAEFQRRLEGELIRVDHSTAGAQEALRLYGAAIGTLIGYVVAGHHTGLPDYGTAADDASLAARLRRSGLTDYGAYAQDEMHFPQKGELALPISFLPSQPHFSLQFFIRMLYSCLVDADFLDTEGALDPAKASLRGEYPAIGILRDRLDRYFAAKFSGVADTPVNRERAAVLQACHSRAAEPTGLFTLTVPTGGGKTLSSLAFALQHAVCNGLERVVYVVPFTSIIEQNAAVFREALGDEAVVEHHSNFQYPREGDENWDKGSASLGLATENWDAPLIVTTNVQFFESLFANRSSRCRKLHSLSRSVVILDEAQMIPTDLLKPSLAALWELVGNYGSTVVLCTATQPALQGLVPPDMPAKEIAPDPARLFEVLRRVAVSQLGAVEDGKLAEEISRQHQALCIVNTRSHARDLHDLLQGKEEVIHLSGRMCPRHRAKVLAEVRRRLRDGAPCLVVSTQLIEAGVDVDFPVVFRAATGLDSLAQAAGRCNREGRLECGRVFLFDPIGHPLRGWFERTATAANMTLRGGADPLSPKSMEQYFATLYDLEGGGLDKMGIMGRIAEGGSKVQFQFAELAQTFRMIEEDMMSVVVPWDEEAFQYVRHARSSQTPYGLLRKVQPYVVQIPPWEFLDLQKNHQMEVLEINGGTMAVLADLSCYSDEVGLQPSARDGHAGEVLIF